MELDPKSRFAGDSSDVPLPDDWARQVMEAHNGWIRCPWGFNAETQHKSRLHYTPGQVARPLIAGFGTARDFAIRPFIVLEAEGNILLSIKAIPEEEYQTGVERQGGDHNI